jgi:hypothetical protein
LPLLEFAPRASLLLRQVSIYFYRPLLRIYLSVLSPSYFIFIRLDNGIQKNKNLLIVSTQTQHAIQHARTTAAEGRRSSVDRIILVRPGARC